MSQVIPYLWFEKQAEEAVNFYISIFKNSKIDTISRYGDAGPLEAGLAMTIEFQLLGQDVMALNGGMAPSSDGQPPVSMFVSCDTQAEVDDVWEKLSAGGKKIQCGWLVDKYGISWNVVPAGIADYLGGDDEAGRDRAMKAMLQMEKLDINELRRAYEGAPA
jgi:predicted 3-demethylubiquinone-9 3-methyltransferase (glyoxalase superfamily)